MLKDLEVKDSTYSNTQLKLFQEFAISQDSILGKNIITQGEFEYLQKKSEEGVLSFWSWIENNCFEGYSYLTKLLFNEDFTLAYIRIGNVCGRLCGGGEERLYEFKNDKWALKESFGFWVS